MSHGSDLHRLSDNQRISAEDSAAALAHISAIRAIHLGALAHVSKHGLDSEIFLPGNIWADLNNETSFFEWSANKIDIARAISPFSGFHLMNWARQDDGGNFNASKMNEWYSELFSKDYPADVIDAMLDERFGLAERMEASRYGLVEMWENLVSGVPDQYRLSVKGTAGEIGVRHEGRILNSDVMSHQSRINALLGSGCIARLEERIARDGRATFMEIGSGSCSFAYALNALLGGQLETYLIDLPSGLGNGCAYLACAAGADAITVVKPDLREKSASAYTLIPNVLIPWFESRLPPIDLVHNAISLNEMGSRQVEYYLNLIDRVLSQGGVFHLSEGQKSLDYHIDAQGAAIARFHRHEVHVDAVNGLNVIEKPNTFCFPNT